MRETASQRLQVYRYCPGCKAVVQVAAIVLLLFLNACSSLLFRNSNQYIQYPVQPGDTVYEISQRFSVSADEILQVNDLSDPRRLAVGQVLKVPYHGQNLAKTSVDGTVTRVSSGGGTSDSFGGMRTRGSTSDDSGLNRVRLGEADRYIGKLVLPVKGGGSYISSRFGRRWLSFHEGLDIAGSVGLPVRAAHAGTVVYSGSSISGYGNMVVVKGEGLITVYGHNDKNRVRVGERVSAGERIADLGQSGKASGPHLHFETRVRNASGRYVAVDPMSFYP